MSAPPTIADLANDIRGGLHSGIFDSQSDRRDRDDAVEALEVLEARTEAAEAALATARVEGAAAERAAWLAELRSDLLNLKVIKADAEDYVRELIEDIEAGAHVRPVGSA
jgi:hypothetical protein